MAFPSHQLKLSETRTAGARYMNIEHAKGSASVLLHEGMDASTSLRQSASQNQQQASRLRVQASLYEAAASKLQHQQPSPGDLHICTVAEALERHLIAADTSVHWVRAKGEDTWAPEKTLWPRDLCACYVIQQGCSEGTIVRVMHQPNRYDASDLHELLTIKLLTAGPKAYVEAAQVSQFIDRLDEAALLQSQH